MARKWFDYTPVGFALNQLSSFLSSGSDVSNSATDLLQGVSDTLFGTHYGQSDLQQQQQDFNAAQAQINRDWQKQMMDYQNQYNSPSAMMQRFRDAGLNPALMISGSAPAIESASPSGGSMASSALGASPHGNISLNDSLLLSQIANIDADTEKKKGETRSLEIKNTVDGMNADAYTVFFQQNENDIIRVMSQDLGIRSNEFILSNYETFESAWNFAITFGVTLEDALRTGQISYAGDFSTLLDNLDLTKLNERFNQSERLFVGGRDATIAANEAIRVMNEAQKLKSQKDFDIWKFLIDKSKHGDKWEKAGAQVALTALFISGEKFNIQMPSFNFHSFKRLDKSTRYNDIYAPAQNVIHNK